MRRSVRTLLAGIAVILVATLPGLSPPVVTVASWQRSVWGGATFARGHYTEGFARAESGAMEGRVASSAQRTHLNPGSTVSGWGSNEASWAFFNARVEGNSTAVVDPAATGDQGATATATARNYRVAHGLPQEVKVEMPGETALTVRCPLDGGPTTSSMPVATPIRVKGQAIAMPEPGQVTVIDVAGTLGIRFVGTLRYNRTLAARTAMAELILNVREQTGLGTTTWEVYTTLVHVECGTTPSTRDPVLHDYVYVRDPEAEEPEEDCRPYLLGIGGVGQRDAEEHGQGEDTFIGKVLERFAATARTHSLDYPSSVWPWGAYTKDQSVGEGRTAAIAAINDYRAQCPDGKVVIIAHSLGAEIAGDIAPHADHVVLFGDPRAPGGIYAAFTGIFPGISGPGPRRLGPNTVSVCNEYSLICDAPAPWVDPIHFGLSVAGFLSGRHSYDYNVDAALGLTPGQYFIQRRNPIPVLPEHTPPTLLPRPRPNIRFPLPFRLPPWQPGPLPHLGVPPPGP